MQATATLTVKHALLWLPGWRDKILSVKHKLIADRPATRLLNKARIYFMFKQGSLTEGEGSEQLTSLY